MIKNTWYYLFIICFILFCTGEASLAQSKKKSLGTLTGQVYDAKTNKVLEGVNIYIPNLNIGTSSNKYGSYRLKKIPPGTYNFVFSMVGYETKTTKFKIEGKFEYEYKIKLVPIEIDLDNVEVIANYPERWKEYYDIFEKNILGEDIDKNDCAIANKEQIDFYYDKNRDLIVALCDTLINIKNYKLGYDLDLKLKKYEYDKVSGYANFDFIVMYRTMQSVNIKEVLKWQMNRIDAFKGSLQHMFSDLASGMYNPKTFIVTEGKLKDYLDERNAVHERVVVNKNDYLTVPGATNTLREKDDFNLADRVVILDEGKYMIPVDKCYKLVTSYSSKYEFIFIESNTKQLIFDRWGNILNLQDLKLTGNRLATKIPDLLPKDYLSR